MLPPLLFKNNMERIKTILDAGPKTVKGQAKTGGELFVGFMELYKEHVQALVPYCGGCPDGFDQAFYQLEIYYNRIISQKLMEKTIDPNRKFILKTGGSVYLSKTHETLTNHNMTDAKALEMLRDNPNHIGSFLNPPKDWAQMISVVEVKQEPVKEEPTEEVSEVKPEQPKKQNHNNNNKKR